MVKYSKIIFGVFLVLLISLISGCYMDNYDDGGNVPSNDVKVVDNSDVAGSEQMKTLIDDDAIKGDLNAPITIVEFSDYECPFCKRHYDQTSAQLIEKYVDTGKVKIVFRDFPLGFHKQAQKAGEAAECAGEQDKYWDMHDKLFTEGVTGGVASFKQYAADLGLDQAEFDECLDSGSMAQEVKDDMAAGQAAGVTGTPAFVIDGQLVVGAQPFSKFEQVIESIISGEAPPIQQAAPKPDLKPVDMEALVDDDSVKGDADAPVTIVEFSDYECPFCKRHFDQTSGQIISEYVDTGKVKLVFRDFPLGFHKQAQKAGEAAECAGEQDKYWDMHDKLFTEGVTGGVASFKQYAADLELDQAEFDECLDSGAMAQEVKDDMADGAAAGVTGTPGFLINGQFVKGAQPFANFKQIIDAELAK